MDQSAFSRTQVLLGAIALSFVALVLTGCEQADDRQLASGQACLDSASTQSDADRCISIVQGLQSDAAYLIRCSANFVAQGFTGKRLASAFQGLKDNPNGSGASDPMGKMMAYLVFSNTTPLHTMSQVKINCAKSGVQSMVRLATAAELATTIASLSGGLTGAVDPSSGSFDETAIKARIAALVTANNPANNAAIGTVVQSANTAYCGAGSAYQSNAICLDIQNAITAGNGDQAAIGARLLSLIQ